MTDKTDSTIKSLKIQKKPKRMLYFDNIFSKMISDHIKIQGIRCWTYRRDRLQDSESKKLKDLSIITEQIIQAENRET